MDSWYDKCHLLVYKKASESHYRQMMTSICAYHLKILYVYKVFHDVRNLMIVNINVPHTFTF